MLKYWGGVIVGVVVVALLTVAVEERRVLAQLLVTKEYDNLHPVLGQPLTINYYLYNLGESLVVNVELNDLTFATGGTFTTLSEAKSLPFHIPEINPNDKYMHSIIVSPLVVGQFGDSPAIVTYQRSNPAITIAPNDENGATASGGGKLETVKVMSTARGLMTIITVEHYNIFIKSHWNEWLILLAVATLIICYPYQRYRQAMKDLKKLTKLN